MIAPVLRKTSGTVLWIGIVYHQARKERLGKCVCNHVEHWRTLPQTLIKGVRMTEALVWWHSEEPVNGSAAAEAKATSAMQALQANI